MGGRAKGARRRCGRRLVLGDSEVGRGGWCVWRRRLGGQREGALGIGVDLNRFEFDRIETEGERMLLMGARERRRQC